ncbi:histidine kinase [Chenggangzhangella methanolivorans]|uniref:histidine kinase n=2 Tax=Chenggangzhangella methanolivorans TaxID=1437009 RepID=A0A9E6RCP5_9HYPH|nr:histidine kinase [Chenggangzhangella methanolivorans]
MVSALLAAWLLAAIIYYKGFDAAAVEARPSPARVAAIVELIERTAPADRDLALSAVSSEALRASLAAPGAALDPSRTDRDWLEPYAAALGGRPLSVSLDSASSREHLFPKLFVYAAPALELRVGLADGATLMFKTRGPVAVTRFGLPVGLGAGLIGTLIALVALIIMQRETRPIARLASAVDEMELLDAHTPIPVPRRGAPEVQALVAAFNRLGERLATLLRARMALLGGISHDVRTFATRLRLQLDQIPDEAERARAENDIADMIRLLDDALLASRAGAGELVQELVEFDAIVRSEVEDRQALGAPVAFSSDGREALVLGDRVALRRIASNLIDNAVAYGRVAHVGLRVADGIATLAVEDEGPGVPPDKRAELLEPFVRLETSRNRRTGGSGLGLAIVRALVDAHGATLAIEDSAHGGARFVARVPLFDPRAGVSEAAEG